MKILTSVVNNTGFIELQYHTLKKHFKGDYEFIVFNDAKGFPDFTNGGDATIRDKISAVCEKLGITCINVPNQHHVRMGMSDRHADTFNLHVLKYQKQNPDRYLLLDSDMFLVSDFDPVRYTKYESAIVPQSRGDEVYFWPGLCYMDFTQIRNADMLDWRTCPGFDSGGMMRAWLKTQTPESIYTIRHLCSCGWSIGDLPESLKENKKLVDFLTHDVRNVDGKFFCEVYDGVFLHYRAGGNWRGEGIHLHQRLTQSLMDALTSTTTSS
jgi:hypothetical protein